MNGVVSFVKGLTLIHAVVIAALAWILATFIVRSGLLNMIAWLVAVGAIIVGAINYLSYGR